MTREPPPSGWPADQDLWEALARYVCEESPAAEAEAIRRWLAEDPRRNELLAALDRSFRGLAFRHPPELDVETALHRVSAQLHESEVRTLHAARSGLQERMAARWRTTALRIAATVALLASGVLLWRAVQDDGGDQVATVAQTFVTAAGQTDSVSLPDGTRVLLGPLSRITVAAGYGTAAREVELTGEALLDVEHDAARPFLVRAGGAIITDLGTTFTVRTDETDEVRVVVTAGSVELRAARAPQGSGVILRAGDRGRLGRHGQVVAERGGMTDDDLAWTRGRIVFDAAPLERVRVELRRWYGIELRADQPLDSRHITATFTDESARQVVDVIALALGALVEWRGDTAVMRAPPGAPGR
jgi:transmembrane sensor